MIASGILVFGLSDTASACRRSSWVLTVCVNVGMATGSGARSTLVPFFFSSRFFAFFSACALSFSANVKLLALLAAVRDLGVITGFGGEGGAAAARGDLYPQAAAALDSHVVKTLVSFLYR